MTIKKRKSKILTKIAKRLVKKYPFNFENKEKYEPTKDEKNSLPMKTVLSSKHIITKVDYMQWKRTLIEKYKYDPEDLKQLTFSESLLLTHKCVCESVAKNLPSRRRLYEPELKKEISKFNLQKLKKPKHEAQQNETEKHDFSIIPISKKELGTVLGLPDDHKIAQQTTTLCKSSGIVLKKVNRQKFRVAIDTLPASMKNRFLEYMREIYRLK